MSWCKLYNEWAFDPKVQTMSESLQRRHAMLLCFHKAGMVPGLTDSEVAHGMRITLKEAQSTKSVFIAKGFIDETWKMLKWEKRQAGMSESRERVARYRDRYRNATVALPNANGNVTETSALAREEKTREEKTPPTPSKGESASAIVYNPPDKIAELASATEIRWPAQNADVFVGDLCRLFDYRLVAQILDQAYDKDPAKLPRAWVRTGCRNRFAAGWSPADAAPRGQKAAEIGVMPSQWIDPRVKAKNEQVAAAVRETQERRQRAKDEADARRKLDLNGDRS